MNGKRPVVQQLRRWFDYIKDLARLELFGILSKQNAVGIGGPRSAAALSGAAAPANLMEKRVKKKE